MNGGEISGNTVISNNPSYPSSGGGVYVASWGIFTKTGGTITGYANDTVNGNAVKDDSGMVLNDRGHAVYAVGGWNGSSNEVIKRRDTGAGPTVNLSYDYNGGSPTYSGGWDNYVVTFKVNGGNGTAPAARDVTSGLGITLPDGNGLSMLDYTFGGWNSRADGAGTGYTAGAFYTPSGDITLYAVWQPGKPVNAVPGAGLAAKLDWLQNNAPGDADYIVEVNADENIGPRTLSYSGKSNIGIILRGVGARRIISLSANGRLFTIESGVILVLDDNITLRGRSGNNDSLVLVNSGGELRMNAGSVITGNTHSSSVGYGGGVYNGGTFTMNGGEISGNSARGSYSYGGGVYNGGTFIMNGGEISGNSVHPSSTTYVADGGGVYAGGTFTMNGGKISGNSVTSRGRGGGVYGSLTMNGGEISGNTAPSSGGGVYATGTFTKTGGTITGYANDTANGNAVKDDYGTVLNDQGHAVFAYGFSSSVTKRKESTAGPGVNLSYDNNGGSTIYGGEWDF